MKVTTECGRGIDSGILLQGRSFWEPPLFADVKYPANAEITSDAEVLQLYKEKFLELMI